MMVSTPNQNKSIPPSHAIDHQILPDCDDMKFDFNISSMAVASTNVLDTQLALSYGRSLRHASIGGLRLVYAMKILGVLGA